MLNIALSGEPKAIRYLIDSANTIKHAQRDNKEWQHDAHDTTAYWLYRLAFGAPYYKDFYYKDYYKEIEITYGNFK